MQIGDYILKNNYSWGSSSDRHDTMVIKMDDSSNIQWAISIGGTEREEVSSVIQKEDGNYIIGINTVSKYLQINCEGEQIPTNGGGWMGNYSSLLLEFNANGELVRNVLLDGENYIVIKRIYKKQNGDYLIGINTNSPEFEIEGKKVIDEENIIIEYERKEQDNPIVTQMLGIHNNKNTITTIARNNENGYIVGADIYR